MDSTSGADRADRGNVRSPRRIVSNLRWWIGALLFASTVINYIDRQTLNVLAPYLKAEYHWTNSDFALIVIAFRLSYAIVQFVGGRVVDVLGTRRAYCFGSARRRRFSDDSMAPCHGRKCATGARQSRRRLDARLTRHRRRLSRDAPAQT